VLGRTPEYDEIDEPFHGHIAAEGRQAARTVEIAIAQIGNESGHLAAVFPQRCQGFGAGAIRVLEGIFIAEGVDSFR
jgi:hypothetical protein